MFNYNRSKKNYSNLLGNNKTYIKNTSEEKKSKAGKRFAVEQRRNFERSEKG